MLFSKAIERNGWSNVTQKKEKQVLLQHTKYSLILPQVKELEIVFPHFHIFQETCDYIANHDSTLHGVKGLENLMWTNCNSIILAGWYFQMNNLDYGGKLS